MEPQTLRGDRVVLSIPVESDLDRITEYCNDPLFERYLPLPWPYSRADAESFVLGYVPRAWAEGTELTWAVRESDDGPLLGMVGWRRRGDMGFWMGAPHRGLGYMTEAVGVVCSWVFATHADVERIEWEATAGNVGSAQVAHRAGFGFTGVRPVEHADRDGSHPDGWHAVLGRDGDRVPQDGWPL